MADLVNLPNELKHYIILELSILDILNLFETCNSFLHLINDDSLWQRLLSRDFHILQKEEETWKEEYKFLIRRDESLLFNALETHDEHLIKFASSLLLFKQLNDPNRILIKAIQKGHYEIVKLIRNKINKENLIDHENIIKIAAKSGQLKIIHDEIKDESFSYNPVRLIKAALYGSHPETIKFVIGLMSRHNLKLSHATILDHAVRTRNIPVLKLSIDLVKEKLPQLILHQQYFELALLNNDQEIINEYFREIGADNAKLNYRQILISAIACDHDETIIKIMSYIRAKGLYIDSGIWKFAGTMGQITAITLLVDYEKSISIVDILNKAARRGHNEIVKSLIDAFRKTNTVVYYGYTLDNSIEHGYFELVKLLLKRMKEVNESPDYDYIFGLMGFNIKDEILEVILDDINEHHVGGEYQSWIYQILERATSAGNESIFDKAWNLLESRPPHIYYESLSNAIKKRRVHIMRKILKMMEQEKIEPHYDDLLISATISGSLMLVKNFLQKNFLTKEVCSLMIRVAVERNYPHILGYIIELINEGTFIINYDTMVSLIIESRNIKLLKFVLDKMAEFQIDINYRSYIQIAFSIDTKIIGFLFNHAHGKEIVPSPI